MHQHFGPSMCVDSEQQQQTMKHFSKTAMKLYLARSAFSYHRFDRPADATGPAMYPPTRPVYLAFLGEFEASGCVWLTSPHTSTQKATPAVHSRQSGKPDRSPKRARERNMTIWLAPIDHLSSAVMVSVFGGHPFPLAASGHGLDMHAHIHTHQ